MITSKQRAYLRAMASGIPTIMQIGKGGITDNLVKTVSDALEARELIKLSVLENSEESARSAAEALAELCEADIVAVPVRKVVLYRESVNHKHIDLPR